MVRRIISSRTAGTTKSNPATPKPPPITNRAGFRIAAHADKTIPNARPTSASAASAASSPFFAAARISVGVKVSSLCKTLLCTVSASLIFVTRTSPGREATVSAQPRPQHAPRIRNSSPQPPADDKPWPRTRQAPICANLHPATTHYLFFNDHICMTFREVRFAQQAELIRLGQTSIGSPKHTVRSASSWTTPTHAAPRVPFLQRRITNPMSDQTPAPGPALHAHPHQPPTYRVQLPLRGVQLFKLKLGDCLYCFWSNQLLCIRLHRR